VNKEIAEDLTSEIFLKALKNFATYNPDISQVAWIMTIARNHVINHWRDQKEVIDVAKGLNMPQTRDAEHAGSLIGKRRQRSDFGSGGDAEFFVPNDMLDGGSLKRELDGAPTSRAALESAAQRIKALKHRIGSSDIDVLNESALTFDGQRSSQ